MSHFAEPGPQVMTMNKANGSHSKPLSFRMFVAQRWATGWFLTIPLVAVRRWTTREQGHVWEPVAEPAHGSDSGGTWLQLRDGKEG